MYGRTDMRSSKYSHTTNHNCKAMAYLVPVATSVNTRLTTIIIHVNITAAIQCAHTRTRLNCLTGTSVQCSVAKKTAKLHGWPLDGNDVYVMTCAITVRCLLQESLQQLRELLNLFRHHGGELLTDGVHLTGAALQTHHLQSRDMMNDDDPSSQDHHYELCVIYCCHLIHSVLVYVVRF